MNAKESETKRATEYRNSLLRNAVEGGAGMVDLERVPEGLEICFFRGSSGMGTVLKDNALETALVELIVRRAGLEDRGRGKMDWNVLGENRRITVEEYDSFGETCFRLKLDKTAPRPKRNQR